MIATRGEIYAALFAIGPRVAWSLAGEPSTAFVTLSRRVRLFNVVGAEERPSLMQAEHDEQTGQTLGLPYRRVFDAHWIIYHAAGRDDQAIPADLNNAILDGVEAALAPLPTDPGWPKRNTLGGLVHHCYIDGEIFKDPGDLDGDGLLIIPIRMLVP